MWVSCWQLSRLCSIHLHQSQDSGDGSSCTCCQSGLSSMPDFQCNSWDRFPTPPVPDLPVLLLTVFSVWPSVWTSVWPSVWTSVCLLPAWFSSVWSPELRLIDSQRTGLRASGVISACLGLSFAVDHLFIGTEAFKSLINVLCQSRLSFCELNLGPICAGWPRYRSPQVICHHLSFILWISWKEAMVLSTMMCD